MAEELPKFLGGAKDLNDFALSESSSDKALGSLTPTSPPGNQENLFGFQDNFAQIFTDNSPFFPSESGSTDQRSPADYNGAFPPSQFTQQFGGHDASNPDLLWNGLSSSFASMGLGSSEGSSDEFNRSQEDQRNDLHSPDLLFQPPFSGGFVNSPFQQSVWNAPGSIYAPPTHQPEESLFNPQYNQFGGQMPFRAPVNGQPLDDNRAPGSRMHMRNPVRNTSMFAPPRQPVLMQQRGHPVIQNHEYPPYNSTVAPRTPPHHHRSSSVDSYIAENDGFNGYNGRSQGRGPYVSPPHTPQGKAQDKNRITSSCRYFANGYCSHGDRCNFEHILPGEERSHHSDNDKDTLFSNNPGRGPRRGRSSVMPFDDKKPLGIDATKLTSLDQAAGQVYSMCKDQHGCRFLQKKLEEKEKNYEAVNMIFDEVYDHMVELMTDPFGNYLCQKLIEHCDEQQQLLIVQKVSPKLVEISKNMHGTRAVQKMIECLCTPSQVQLVVNALKSSVVSLIQDLNGNHVIQRCLNRLSYRDKQFIYDAVANNAIEVATHRHGCCVMQRCIDSASEPQKLQLVRQISRNALSLVKDQFGNYVVQYVLDLDFDIVRIQLIQEFCGHIAGLSTQKFSSNVIEKCLHVAVPSVQAQLIEEIMQPNTLSLLLQDPYGNYVIQTALSIARPEQYARLVEEIKPLLSALRNTPYGKRIQNKIAKDI